MQCVMKGIGKKRYIRLQRERKRENVDFSKEKRVKLDGSLVS